MDTTCRPTRAAWYPRWLIATLAFAGCEAQPGGPRPGDEALYVEIMIALYVIDERPPQVGTLEQRTRAGDSLRAETLRKHGLEPEDLLALAESLGEDPARMQVLFEDISSRVDSLVLAADEAAPAGDSIRERPRFEPDSADDRPLRVRSRPDSVPAGEVYFAPDPTADSAVQAKLRRLQQREEP